MWFTLDNCEYGAWYWRIEELVTLVEIGGVRFDESDGDGGDFEEFEALDVVLDGSSSSSSSGNSNSNSNSSSSIGNEAVDVSGSHGVTSATTTETATATATPSTDQTSAAVGATEIEATASPQPSPTTTLTPTPTTTLTPGSLHNNASSNQDRTMTLEDFSAALNCGSWSPADDDSLVQVFKRGRSPYTALRIQYKLTILMKF